MFFGDLQSTTGWSSSQIDYVNGLINSKLARDSHSAFYKGLMEVDYDMVGEGFVLTNKYLTTLLDGTFHCLNDSSFEGSHRSERTMPNYSN
jgi:hypothetical protein